MVRTWSFFLSGVFSVTVLAAAFAATDDFNNGVIDSPPWDTGSAVGEWTEQDGCIRGEWTLGDGSKSTPKAVLPLSGGLTLPQNYRLDIQFWPHPEPTNVPGVVGGYLDCRIAIGVQDASCSDCIWIYFGRPYHQDYGMITCAARLRDEGWDSGNYLAGPLLLEDGYSWGSVEDLDDSSRANWINLTVVKKEANYTVLVNDREVFSFTDSYFNGSGGLALSAYGWSDDVLWNGQAEREGGQYYDNFKLLPFLEIRKAVKIQWASTEGETYQVYRSDDVKTWQPVGDAVVGDGAMMFIFDDIEGAWKNYYKLEVQ